MTNAVVKVPKNRQSRVSDDIWIAGQALSEFLGTGSPREGWEACVRNYVVELATKNPKFSELWEKAKSEGVQDG